MLEQLRNWSLYDRAVSVLCSSHCHFLELNIQPDSFEIISFKLICTLMIWHDPSLFRAVISL